MRTLALVFVVILLGLAPVALAQHDCAKPHCGPYSEDPGDSCLGSDDPFCDFTDRDGDYPSWCFVCSEEMTCIMQDEGKTGRTSCTAVTEGTEPVDCWTYDNFCENVTVSP